MLLLADNPATRSWFIGDFVPDVLELVLNTWDRFQRRADVKLEQRITNLFCDELERAYLEEGKNWFVFPDIKRNHPITGKELARHDIRFYHRNIQGQTLYFVFECKRLNVQRGKRIIPNTSTYTAGMFRFINGQYSAEHPCGGMIGYIMDGNVRKAVEAAKTKIEKQRSFLRLLDDGAYTISPLMPKYKYNGETKHSRADGPFILYHLLLKLKLKTSNTPHR